MIAAGDRAHRIRIGDGALIVTDQTADIDAVISELVEIARHRTCREGIDDRAVAGWIAFTGSACIVLVETDQAAHILRADNRPVGIGVDHRAAIVADQSPDVVAGNECREVEAGSDIARRIGIADGDVVAVVGDADQAADLVTAGRRDISCGIGAVTLPVSTCPIRPPMASGSPDVVKSTIRPVTVPDELEFVTLPSDSPINPPTWPIR